MFLFKLKKSWWSTFCQRGAIAALLIAWIFSGYPQIWDHSFPPKTEEAEAATSVVYITDTALTTWTVPLDWDSGSITVEVIGGGGGGANGIDSAPGAGGGGGASGAYAIKSNLSLTPDSPITIKVGAGGGVATAGGDTYFNGENCAGSSACGKAGGGASGQTGASAQAGSVGDSVNAGANGGTGGDAGGRTGAGGGGGGGAGGPSGAGNAGTSISGYLGGAGGKGGGTAGGAGGYASSGAGGNGTEWQSSPAYGSGGGGGGGNGGSGKDISGVDAGASGTYGAGGGGGGGDGSGAATSGAGKAGKQGLIVITYTPNITSLGNNASEPSTTTIGPDGPITDLDNFTLETNAGTDTMTDAIVTLGPAGAYNNIAQVDITDTSNTAKCTAVTTLTSNTVTFASSTCSILITNSPTTYKIRITPKNHTAAPAMPSVPGASYATTGTIVSFSSTNAQSKSDTTSATITIDNASPAGVTSTSGSADNAKVTLNWTTTNNETATSTVLRWAASSPGAEVPVEGATYTAGNTIVGAQTATVACVFAAVAQGTAEIKIDGTGGSAGCTTDALANGTAYSYKIFQQDAYGNYDAGVDTDLYPFTPAAPPTYGNIDTTDKYAWGENIGWQNWRPDYGGVTVYDECLIGYTWAENVGWINAGDDSGSCTGSDCCQTGTTKGYENDSNSTDDDGDGKIDDWGVNNDGSGNLSGYAWGENVGWVNFKDTSASNYQVVINGSSEFTGYAWGENVGWINMNCANENTCGTADYKVKTSWVGAAVSITLDPEKETFAYGVVNADTASSTLGLWGGEGITATNGAAIADFDIYGANTAGWTLSDANNTGNNYMHEFCNETLNDCSLPAGDANYVNFTTPGLTEFKATVGIGEEIAFQLRITTPATPTAFAQQSAVVTIQASAP